MSIHMNKDLTAAIEEFCSALSSPERISLIKALGENEVCACRLIEKTGMNPMVALNHMHVLRHAGIVAERKEGEWSYFKVLSRDAIEAAAGGSCIEPVSTQGYVARVPAQNIDAAIGKYKASYVYEAEALFRRGF